MGSHPLNLLFRFLFEIAALASAAYWGWNSTEYWYRYPAAILLPILMGILWTTFNVPNDPSRSGKAPVKVPGWFRLLIELGIFGFGVWCIYDLGYPSLALIFGIMLVIHYIISYDRIKWLLER